MSFPVWLFGPQSFSPVNCPRCNGEDHVRQGSVNRARSVGSEATGDLYGCLGCGLAFGVVQGRVFKVGERASVPLQNVGTSEQVSTESHMGVAKGRVIPIPRRDDDMKWGEE